MRSDFPKSRKNISPTRRRFVQGLAASSAASFLWRSRAKAQAANPAVLQGDRFDLDIAPMEINFTGRPRIATLVNGMLPAPTLRWREGDNITINVTNHLTEDTSIHWHGILLPAPMDGVPGLSFPGIKPGERFTYRFPVKQSGTYWYHSHSGMQEQTGMYGALVIQSRWGEAHAFDREHVIVLSDWTDEDPMTVVANLKMESHFYNRQERTLGTFFDDAGRMGFGTALSDRLMWGNMRMSATDIMDVNGSTYSFLVNGHPPAANWTALFEPGERVRLRVINASAMTTFDIRIPGLELQVVQADGVDIQSVSVEEFRIGVAETYDVIVTPEAETAYTIFAQAQDRSGYARATLAPREGMSAVVPAMDPRPLRTMADMGMDHGAMNIDQGAMDHGTMPMGDAPAMPAMDHASAIVENADGIDPTALRGHPNVANIAQMPRSRLAEAGTGLDGNGRRVLTYADLRSLSPHDDMTPPSRTIEFHLTGNMERFVWGFNGKKFSESEPIRIQLGEKVRFTLINNTMMEHPIHLHGFFTVLENGQGNYMPLKHTVNVKPGERLNYFFIAHTPGHWAFHCHLLYHMETGMFRTILVS